LLLSGFLILGHDKAQNSFQGCLLALSCPWIWTWWWIRVGQCSRREGQNT
jgi:hypothetical protein